MIKLGVEKPSGQHLRAIIDTAESSSISMNSLTELNLIPLNFRSRISTDGIEDHPVFDTVIQIKFRNLEEPVNFQLEVAGLTLDEFGIYVLLGRDILRHCELHYNGKTGKFTLNFVK